MATRLYINGTEGAIAKVLSSIYDLPITTADVTAVDTLDKIPSLGWETKQTILKGITGGERIDYFRTFGLGRLELPTYAIIERLKLDPNSGTIEAGSGHVEEVLRTALWDKEVDRLVALGLVKQISISWS